MLESGGSCRCRRDEEELDDEDEDASSCCTPQVFTSVLLGILACVLMTGGVFLAFHRWDPLWLIVSGIGVLLILIGSILHCCTEAPTSRRGGKSSGKGGCCGRPPTEHHLHLVANNGSLTEQLLPLSNARSVSQLSLNMLPGYFPPVVTTYGIEQHSAVVQNINRIVQQQQLTQQSLGSNSPGVQGAPPSGKSFILLSLPADTSQANLQNLVATVYQLEGSSTAETPATDATPVSPTATVPATTPVPSTPPPTASIPTTPAPALFKHVEVQTCNVWSNSAIVNNALQNTASTSTSSTELSHLDIQSPSTSTTQTELTPEHVNLMDCSNDIPPVCDNVEIDDPSVVANTPEPSSDVLVDVSGEALVPLQSSLVVAIPETQDSHLSPSTEVLMELPRSSTEVHVEPPCPSTEVLVEITDQEASCSVANAPSDVLIDISGSSPDEAPSIEMSQPSETAENLIPTSEFPIVVLPSTNGDENTNSNVQSEAVISNGSNQLDELSSSSSNLSDIDGEMDDSELLERSSPPPSYDDATHEGEGAIGAFGLAYGTI